MWNVVALGFLMGVVAMLIITPKEVYQGIVLIQYGKLTKEDKYKSWIPLYNIIKAESMYTGKLSSILVTTTALLLLIVVRVICAAILPEAAVLNSVTGLCAYVSLLAYYVSLFVFNFKVLNDAGCVSILKTIFLALVVPVGQDYIGRWLPRLIKHSIKEEEGVF